MKRRELSVLEQKLRVVVLIWLCWWILTGIMWVVATDATTALITGCILGFPALVASALVVFQGDNKTNNPTVQR